MEYRKLSDTGEELSVICLGTMTWGEQNTQDDAFEQMNYSLEQGVNFFDTAELYPTPAKEETAHSTERMIGNWFKETGNRDKIFLASKIVGRNPGLHWFRGEDHIMDKANILQAIEGSLERLQTDRIDLYQLHWPDRKTNFFGRLNYVHEEEKEDDYMRSTLEGLEECVKAGKVRYVGVSNETPWGLMKYLELAKDYNLPRMVSIQNPYNLLNRSFEIGLSEISHRENVGLLAYSPLGFGVLSGKYLNGYPKGTRLELFGDYFKRYLKPQAVGATQKYADLAKKAGMTPTQLALSFVNQQSFLTSNIIGATTMEQLKENIASIDIKIDNSIIEAIEEIHVEFPNPCP